MAISISSYKIVSISKENINYCYAFSEVSDTASISSNRSDILLYVLLGVLHKGHIAWSQRGCYQRTLPVRDALFVIYLSFIDTKDYTFLGRWNMLFFNWVGPVLEHKCTQFLSQSQPVLDRGFPCQVPSKLRIDTVDCVLTNWHIDKPTTQATWQNLQL